MIKFRLLQTTNLQHVDDKKIQDIYSKMINFDDVGGENIVEHNRNWPQILYHPYRVLIIDGSGSGKTNALFNLIAINQILVKVIYLLRIHMQQNIYC